jgi:hypothetical protein
MLAVDFFPFSEPLDSASVTALLLLPGSHRNMPASIAVRTAFVLQEDLYKKGLFANGSQE